MTPDFFMTTFIWHYQAKFVPLDSVGKFKCSLGVRGLGTCVYLGWGSKNLNRTLGVRGLGTSLVLGLHGQMSPPLDSASSLGVYVCLARACTLGYVVSLNIGFANSLATWW